MRGSSDRALHTQRVEESMIIGSADGMSYTVYSVPGHTYNNLVVQDGHRVFWG